MKILITGITGMVGSFFYKMYKEKGDDVYGITRNSASTIPFLRLRLMHCLELCPP
jgi:GDP-D-mannose dehydratase